mgnify:CR=1 FL=1
MGKSIAARQPVLDSNQKVIAYEIVFKDSFEEKSASAILNLSAEEISSDLEFFEESSLADGKKIFINFNYELIKKEIPALLSKDKIGIEISESVNLEPEVIEKIESMLAEAADTDIYRDFLEDNGMDYNVKKQEEFKDFIDKQWDIFAEGLEDVGV